MKGAETMKNKKKIIALILSIPAAILIIAMFVWVYLTQRITMNPPGTVGNTPGNLNNEGLFCEHDGTVYFFNPYPDGGIFAMEPDERSFRRINYMKARNILAGGDFLYYFETGTMATSSKFDDITNMKSFNRCRLNGSQDTALTRDLVVTAQLSGNYLYLLTAASSGPSFYKMKIDDSEKTILADYNINPACAVNDVIYYNGTQNDHALYQLNTSNDVPRTIWNGDVWNPVVDGDFVYYMDVSNNYRLSRYSLSQGITQQLTEDRVDCFNVGSGYIYYQKNDQQNPELKYMRLDGTDAWPLANGNFTHINMTSQYVYFQEFGNENTLYHSRLGTSTYQPFTAAKEAAAAAK